MDEQQVTQSDALETTLLQAGDISTLRASTRKEANHAPDNDPLLNGAHVQGSAIDTSVSTLYLLFR